jgi:hypothetical protein
MLQETRDANLVKEEVERVRLLGERYPKGTDFSIANSIIYKVEVICDKQRIPFHVVDEATASTAYDYTNLHNHELGR